MHRSNEGGYQACIIFSFPIMPQKIQQNASVFTKMPSAEGYYALLGLVSSLTFLADGICSLLAALALQQKRSTKHTDSRQRTSSHSSRRRSRALGRRARGASRRIRSLASGGDSDAVGGRSLHARARASGHGGGVHGARSRASLAARPSRPRRIGAPRSVRPA